MPPKLFFCHIPKTGGTSLRKALEPLYRPWEILPDEYMMARNDGRYPHPQQIAQTARSHPDKVRLIRGHYHLSLARLMGEDTRTIVVLRDPLRRAVSHLEHMVSVQGADARTIERKLEAGIFPFPDNLMTRYLRGEVDITHPNRVNRSHRDLLAAPLADDKESRASLLGTLESCDYVGVTENLDELAMRLSSELLGAPLTLARENTMKQKRITITRQAEDFILSQSQLDLALFERAKGIHHDRRTPSGKAYPVKGLLRRVTSRAKRVRIS